MDFTNWKLVEGKNPGLLMSGDLSHFYQTTKPKGAINPETGLPEYGFGEILGQASSAASAYGSFGAPAATSTAAATSSVGAATSLSSSTISVVTS